MAEEIREFAERVLFSESLDEKLRPISELVDEHPGRCPRIPQSPGRPRGLAFKKGGEAARFPRLQELEKDPVRARLLHFFANHELLATELMALVLLKFPDAPAAFRRGVAKTLMEEQVHTRLYMDRMHALGCEFGDYPVTGYFWDVLHTMESPLGYVTGLPLTFEQANLDFSRYFYQVFDEIGDEDSRDLMDRIYRDEIRHVAYGLKWFRSWKNPDQSDWEAYQEQLRPPLSPRRAKGNQFNIAGRQKCGLDPEFIQALSVFSKSKGRCPDVFYFNPFGELEISQGRSFTPNKQQCEFRDDLETLPQFFGGEDDVVLVSREPSMDWLLSMKENGLFVPEFEVLRDGQISKSSELRERSLGTFKPWARTPASLALTRGIVGQFKHDSSQLGSAVEETESRSLFAKSRSCALLRDVLERDSDEEWLIPATEVGVILRDKDELDLIEGKLRERWGTRLVAKADFGAAGNRMQRLWEPELQEAQKRWMEKVLRQGERLVVEPWHDRVLDFSAHYDVSAESAKFRGFVRMHNDLRGQFFGSSLASHLTAGLNSELPRFLHGGQGDRHRTLFESLEEGIHQRCVAAKYEGPVGVDAYIYRNMNGELRLRPIVEMNPRFTMGRLLMGLRRFSVPGRLVSFVLVSQVQLQKLKLDSFVALEEHLRRQFPVEMHGHPKARIQSGAVCLNDAKRAKQCVAVLLVGEAGFSWPKTLLNPDAMTD